MIKTVHSSSNDLDNEIEVPQIKPFQDEPEDFNNAYIPASKIAYEMFVGHTLKPRAFDFKKVIENP